MKRFVPIKESRTTATEVSRQNIFCFNPSILGKIGARRTLEEKEERERERERERRGHLSLFVLIDLKHANDGCFCILTALLDKRQSCLFCGLRNGRTNSLVSVNFKTQLEQ